MTNIQKVFLTGWDQYYAANPVSQDQRKAAESIMRCKTEQMGSNTSVCPNCGHKRIHYNSCRNRNCPSCQAVPKEIWVDKRSSEVIDGPYFHVVFTVPAELNPLFYANQKLLYSLIHTAAAQTILELAADPKYLGAAPGIIQVLHSWGQKLTYHPHVHCIVTGSGLTKENKLIHGPKKNFFIPVNVLMKKFRGKFLHFLKKYYSSGKLHFPKASSDLLSETAWLSFCNTLYEKDWCPFIKQTFNGNGNAIEYLGRYTHKIAISNSRIVDISADTVSFKARDYRTGKNEVVRISCVEFIRRFLMHVLPQGFQKIRYYGIFSNRNRSRNLKLIFRLQGHQRFKRKFEGLSNKQIAELVWNIDFSLCPVCRCHCTGPPGKTQ